MWSTARSVGWSIAPSIDRSVCVGSVGRVAARSVGRPVGRSVGPSGGRGGDRRGGRSGRSPGRLIGRSLGCSFGRHVMSRRKVKSCGWAARCGDLSTTIVHKTSVRLADWSAAYTRLATERVKFQQADSHERMGLGPEPQFGVRTGHGPSVQHTRPHVVPKVSELSASNRHGKRKQRCPGESCGPGAEPISPTPGCPCSRAHGARMHVNHRLA